VADIQWSFELACAGHMSPEGQMKRVTTVRVFARNLAEAKERAAEILGDEAREKTVYYPMTINELGKPEDGEA